MSDRAFKDYVTIRQAAVILKWKKARVMRMIRRGEFKTAQKLDWVWLIKREEVNRLRRRLKKADRQAA